MNRQTIERPLSLSVAVATIGRRGIERFAASIPQPVQEVEWVVSWQESHHTEIPAPLLRQDVRIFRFGGKGLSRNRNNAVANASASIILIADDDTLHTPASLHAVIGVFNRNPEIDVACFKAAFPFEKRYPVHSQPLCLPLPKGYSVASVELAFRRDVAGTVVFNPMLGLGSEELHGGEDEYFLLQCIKKGFSCHFIDEEICRHPGFPTGSRECTTGNLRASGCLIAKTYPLSFPLRIVLKALRIAKSGRVGFSGALHHLAIGAWRSRKID